MKFITLSIAFIIFFSCTKKESNKSYSENSSIDSSVTTEKFEYQKKKYFIYKFDDYKHSFKKANYNQIVRLYDLLIKESINDSYTDSITKMKMQAEKCLLIDKKIRDSTANIHSFAYFEHFNLPKLKKINHKNTRIEKDIYKFEFSKFDSTIIGKNGTYCQYISLQSKNKYITLTAKHLDEDSHFIYIYCIDSTFKIIDSKLLEFGSGEHEGFVEDFKYKNIIIKIDLESDYTETTFLDDSTFNIKSSTFYTIRKEKNKNSYKEVGEESNITYRLTKDGKFVILEDKSFKKEYVDLYHANEPSF
ncbi:MAG: hypothetical protein EAZ53_00760 [Bacteroidetes bacterium]|nr:MAG: hypothetical protein EAZ53_00760 [Bacteroidota bacterium]